MKRKRIGISIAASACALVAVVSGRVYGTSLSSDGGLIAPSPPPGTPPTDTPGALATSTATADSPATTATSATVTTAIAPTSTTGTNPAGTACPSGLPGSELVFIPAPTPYCIDAREVTQGEYGTFLQAAKEQPPAQPSQCMWNDRFEPIPFSNVGPNGEVIDKERPIGSCPAGTFDPVAHAPQAVRCVDWCDAFAYCAWAGKRLCGAIGPKPQVDQDTRARSATISELQFVCTGGGAHAFPYGDTYSPGKCADANAMDSVRQGSGNPACADSTLPFSRVRDLVGNVFEWTADCDATGDNCLMLGGYFSGPGVTQSCADSGGFFYSHDTLDRAGIRCCADAVAP